MKRLVIALQSLFSRKRLSGKRVFLRPAKRRDAIKQAEKFLINIHNSSESLPNNYFDKIISNHCLQHCENPLFELENLNRSLKKNGLAIIVVSCANINLKYKPNDVNYQLYSWSPMNLGNLFDAANFKIISIDTFKFKWIPKYNFFYKIFGKKIFNILCQIYGLFDQRITQVRIVVKKN